MRFLRGWYVLGSTDRAYGVGQRDPRHDLLAAADRPAEAQTERQLHLPERPAASAEHHPVQPRCGVGPAQKLPFGVGLDVVWLCLAGQAVENG